MRNNRISFITTVYNEEKTIAKLLDSVFTQTKLPDEIIIVDGKSTDKTVKKIKTIQTKYKNYKGSFKVLIKKGNRSTGRNEAIRSAKGTIIVCTDAGNVLDKNWIKNITAPFKDSKIDVVAGYYTGLTKNLFQKCLLPYVLVMMDKVNPKDFLPATRSLAFKKSIWEKAGRFNERYSHNEDYVFAHKLREIGAKMTFAKDAIVSWIPRQNIKQVFIMFFRFAYGDMEAGIVRNKVLLLFARYFLFFYLLSLLIIYKSFAITLLFGAGVFGYLVWAAQKNYFYVKRKSAIPIFILIQFIADLSVISGSLGGIAKRITLSIPQYLQQNKIVTLLISIYVIVMISLISWGIPNTNHPFLYHMDEWHQSQAVRNVFTKGTPNTEGSANGTMFQFYLSGLYLAPFIVFHIVNPFAITNSIAAIDMQHLLFIIFRLNTILFGVATMILVGILGKRFFNIPSGLSVFFLSVTPLWYSLSNYFKYDIALTFWIVLTLFFFFEYGRSPTRANYLLAGVSAGLACATKISAIAFLPLYILIYFLFTKEKRKNKNTLIEGVLVFFIILIIFGIPDLIFGKGNILTYLYENIVLFPKVTADLNLGMSQWTYLFTKSFPLLFGPALFIAAVSTLLLILIKLIRKIPVKKFDLLLLFTVIFFEISLLPLKLGGGGNRAIVLLPLLVLCASYGLILLQKKYKKLFFITLCLGIGIQILITFAFLYPKLHTDIRATSSIWIDQNIPKQATIGIIVPPLYEYSPDIILKDYYQQVYYPKSESQFRYQDITKGTRLTAQYVVVSNSVFEKKLYPTSVKAMQVKRLESAHYKKVAEFTPKIFMISNLDMYFTGLLATPYSITIYSRK